ncbi:spore cortex-lytic enzyme precursor [Clostridium acetireducens DSM 10703]|uniref:Spore cortex-lytic enzyme n=1 Tax=Clostridium acetireducens DSM 10703 TaxID=1121290 RepID=A0A1E8EWR6_9CLOT|nr:spore cortex-lytic enzyme [Clostridium acetireducens]OFI05079.1 spore cortex-lytic enzyme precursor [Clostridium acetireducens DSM 10703]
MKYKNTNFTWKEAIVFILAILISYSASTVYIAPYKNAAKAITYYYGSRGDLVYTIQKKLKNWGYYDGNIDGIYAYKTFTAVKKFQSKNGLKVDGVVGDATLQALGINTKTTYTSSTSKTLTNPDVALLARLINGEARGEPYEGQVAVGAVVLNRTRSPQFPSTIAGVIYQPGAYTAIADGQINAALEQSSVNAARDALNGWDPSEGALYYFNPVTATSKWIWSRPLIKVIGKHRFCR